LTSQEISPYIASKNVANTTHCDDALDCLSHSLEFTVLDEKLSVNQEDNEIKEAAAVTDVVNDTINDANQAKTRKPSFWHQLDLNLGAAL